MEKVIGDLFTNKYTEVWYESKKYQKFGAPHHFEVMSVPRKDQDTVSLSEIDFQEGPVKENGVNGVCNEDLIAMVITRLESFQNTPFKCRENALAITKLEEALMWLRKRTAGRENRGVEGTHQI